MEQIIVFMSYRELAFLKARNVFQQWIVKFCDNFSGKENPPFLLLCNAYNLNIDAYVYYV